MTETLINDRHTFHVGHVLNVIQDIPTGSVNCVITSPPYYKSRDYSGDQVVTWPDGQVCALGHEDLPEDFVEHLAMVFDEVYRVLRDDGVCWIVIGDTFYTGSAPMAGDLPDVEGRGRRSGLKHPNRGATVRWSAPKHPYIKTKNKLLIPYRLAIALQMRGWILRSDIVWCLSGDTMVYARTPEGERPVIIKDMVKQRPSAIQLWTGEKWSQVMGWSNNYCADGIEIELRSGEMLRCTPGHVWPTARGPVAAQALQLGDILDSTILPEPVSPIEPAGLSDALVGWFIGMYMAEGSHSEKVIQISGHESETHRIPKLQRLADLYHGTCKVYTEGKKLDIHLSSPVLNGILDTYIGGRTSHDKHLRVKTWQRSNVFLRAILEGYLEGDGHWDAESRRWRLGFTDNLNLARDLRTLCARLGMGLRLRRRSTKIGDRIFPGYQGDLFPFRSTHFNSKSDKEIVRLGGTSGYQFWDIGIEDDPHLFALASGVLTHNSKPNAKPNSAKDRPGVEHETILMLTKEPAYYYANTAYQVRRQDRGWRGLRSVWSIPIAIGDGPSTQHHARFPEEIAKRCLLLGCPPGGMVLDLFGGSGTVSVVAEKEGRSSIYIDCSMGYAGDAMRRVSSIGSFVGRLVLD